MNFKIEEQVRQHSFLDDLKKIFTNILKIITFVLLMPLMVFSWLKSKFENKNEAKIFEEWKIFIENDSIKLFRFFINEDECPENLDYPSISNDIYLFKVKSEPTRQELVDKFFSLSYAETEKGIYLISFNLKGQGMTLWFINKETTEVESIKELTSNWWHISSKEKKIILKAATKDKDYYIEINEQ